jgi:hypothetical protein
MTQKHKVFLGALIGAATIAGIALLTIHNSSIQDVQADLQYDGAGADQSSSYDNSASSTATGLSFSEVAQQAGATAPTSESAEGLSYEELKPTDEETDEQVSPASEYANKLIQPDNSYIAYWVSPAGVKIAMPTDAIFDSYGNKWKDVREVPDEVFNSIPNAEYIKLKGNAAIYYIQGKTKRYVTQAAASELNIDPAVVIEVNKMDFNYYKTGAQVKSAGDVIK